MGQYSHRVYLAVPHVMRKAFFILLGCSRLQQAMTTHVTQMFHLINIMAPTVINELSICCVYIAMSAFKYITVHG